VNEKPKRKHGSASPSLWKFPKPFRYEVRGNFKHIIQAIETLTTKQPDIYTAYDVQIFSGALDGDVTFTIDSYFQSQRGKADPYRNSQLHGWINSVQPGYSVVEGYALMGNGNSILRQWIACSAILLIAFVISSYAGDPSACICSTWLMALPLMTVFTYKVSRDDLLRDLLMALQTYPMPVDEDPLHTESDGQPPSQAAKH
jgi:hypothetical protein